MKAFLRCSLGFALGLWSAAAGAEEIQWRSSKREVAPAAATAPVRLGLPAADGVLIPATFRAKNDGEDPRPLPLGPSLKGEKLGEPRKVERMPSVYGPVPDGA